MKVCQIISTCRIVITLITGILSIQAYSPAVAENVDDGEVLVLQALELLHSLSFKDKSKAASLLGSTDTDSARTLLEHLLESRLFIVKKSKRVVIAEKIDNKKYAVSDALDQSSLGEIGKRKIKKIGINNALRTQIRGLLANKNLRNPDPAMRLAAIKQLLNQSLNESAATVKPFLDSETNVKVRDTMELIVTLVELNSADPTIRLRAIEALNGNVHPHTRVQLTALRSRSEDKSEIKSINRVLDSIEQKIYWLGIVENLFFGLSLGSVLVLAAIGLAITFGVMGVINMAHGELIMIGAYVTYVVQLVMPQQISASLLISVPCAFVVAALVGIAIERGVIQFLKGRPLETLLATFGISLILQQAVRSIFSPLNRSVESPHWMSGAWEINSALSLTYNRLYIIFFCLLVFALLYVVLNKTSLGLHVRAVSQNRSMARALGVRSEWVDSLTFGLGSGVAGVAGVALSQLTNVGPNLGQAYIIDSFMVVVFGGVGYLWGTLVSGMSLGMANKLIEPWSGAVLAKILVLVGIILFIQKRPRGLFPQKGRAVEA